MPSSASAGKRGSVEAGDRMSRQRKVPLRAVAGRNAQAMVDEIEVDLERSRTVRHRRRRQSARRDVERHMPGMIEPGRFGQPDLADDLGPELQRRTGVTPRRRRQFRPRAVRIVAHARTLRVPAVKAEGLSRIHGAFRKRGSRFRAFPAAPLAARGAVKAPAPPAPRHGLQRPARQLSHKKNFDHH